jgi:hypothetical protein
MTTDSDNFIKCDNYFNKLTHWIFPARTKLKELIYWPTELAASVLVFIYIIQMDVNYQTIYDNGRSRVDVGVLTHQPRVASDANAYKEGGALSGLSYSTSEFRAGKSFPISARDTDLINREYAWICLCYIIKHAFYFADTFMNNRKFKGRWYDYLTNLSNLALWTVWGLYGWVLSNEEIHAGMYRRYRNDGALHINSSNTFTERIEKLELYTSVNDMAYHISARGTPLWICCLVIFAINTLLFIRGVWENRSSIYHGQALSTIAIPAQLFFLHLFFKGAWIKSNLLQHTGDYDTTDDTTKAASKAAITNPAMAMNIKDYDWFEAKWVFWIIYLAAYAGAVFGFICLMKFATKWHECKVTATKYLCYFFFWISAFVWTLFMDDTLYHMFVNWKTALIVFHAICLFFACCIGVLSFIEKNKAADKYYETHATWDYFKFGSEARDCNSLHSWSDDHYEFASQSNHHGSHSEGKGTAQANSSENQPLHSGNHATQGGHGGQVHAENSKAVDHNAIKPQPHEHHQNTKQGDSGSHSGPMGPGYRR